MQFYMGCIVMIRYDCLTALAALAGPDLTDCQNDTAYFWKTLSQKPPWYRSFVGIYSVWLLETSRSVVKPIVKEEDKSLYAVW